MVLYVKAWDGKKWNKGMAWYIKVYQGIVRYGKGWYIEV